MLACLNDVMIKIIFKLCFSLYLLSILTLDANLFNDTSSNVMYPTATLDDNSQEIYIVFALLTILLKAALSPCVESNKLER